LWERQGGFHKVLIERNELRSSGDTPSATALGNIALR
jgi:hypothetical protein